MKKHGLSSEQAGIAKDECIVDIEEKDSGVKAFLCVCDKTF